MEKVMVPEYIYMSLNAHVLHNLFFKDCLNRSVNVEESNLGKIQRGKIVLQMKYFSQDVRVKNK